MSRFHVLALAAGASVVCASTAIAQQPRSTTRIPLGKDRAPATQQGAPATQQGTAVHTDTVRLPAKVDTVTKTVTQTVRDTVVRVDTVVRTMPAVLRQIGGLYAGFAVGAALPDPNFSNSDHPGWHVEVPFGYDPMGRIYGVRADVGYGQFMPHDWVAGTLSNAHMLNADVDLKLRMVTATPYAMRIQMYALAGPSFARYKEILELGSAGYQIGNNVGGNGVPANDANWQQGFGWNAGAGMEIGTKRSNFFVEARYTSVAGVASNIASTPILIGMTLY